MTEKTGLYGKYSVINNETGEQVADCFVLRPERDIAALHALSEYAARCWHDEQLQNDLREWVARIWASRGGFGTAP